MLQKLQSIKPAQYTRKKIESYSYGLSEEIGKGYSSKVYKGRHDDTDEQVAVKVIDLKMLKNEINRELLNSQIEILKELRDAQNILYLHDIFTTKNNTYIVTQLCISDLNKVIKKRIKENDVYEFMNAIIIGYLQIHKRHIVHRDLKPANILISDKNKVKIADFGFAVKIEALVKSSKYNVGSPLYMAPESLKKNQYSYKSDIWALGIIFYEMMFNDTPWKAKNEKELIKKIESQPIQNIIDSKNLNNYAKQFLSLCLKVDKNERMSPQELAQYSFSIPSNILTEKILNSSIKNSLRSNNLVSNSPSYSYLKNNQIDKSLQKQTFQKNVKCRQAIQNNESIHMKNIENLKIIIQSPSTFKKPQQKTLRTEGISKEEKKDISKILISEVHYCRFLFKLMQKMKQSTKQGLLQNICEEQRQIIFKNYGGIIRHKIDNLNNFNNNNFIKCEGYKQYKQTTDYEKLLNISKEYNDRYKIEIHKYWNEPYNLSIEPTNQMIIVLYDALKQAVTKMNNPEQQITLLSKEVVILDYLITSRQLIEMIKSNPDSYEKFAKKSRIQDIVEGKTVEIHFQLYSQIMQRVKQIMEKNHFVSFGGQTTNQMNLIVL